MEMRGFAAMVSKRKVTQFAATCSTVNRLKRLGQAVKLCEPSRLQFFQIVADRYTVQGATGLRSRRNVRKLWMAMSVHVRKACSASGIGKTCRVLGDRELAIHALEVSQPSWQLSCKPSSSLLLGSIAPSVAAWHCK